MLAQTTVILYSRFNMIFLAIIVALPAMVLAQSSSTESFASQIEQSPFDIFLPDEFHYGDFAASIVNVCSATTTWALKCTAPASESKRDMSSSNPLCGADAPTLTITEAETLFAVSNATPTGTRSVVVQQSCSLSGDWTGTCVGEYVVQGPQPTTHMSTTTLSGRDSFRGYVELKAIVCVLADNISERLSLSRQVLQNSLQVITVRPMQPRRHYQIQELKFQRFANSSLCHLLCVGFRLLWFRMIADVFMSFIFSNTTSSSCYRSLLARLIDVHDVKSRTEWRRHVG